MSGLFQGRHLIGYHWQGDHRPETKITFTEWLSLLIFVEPANQPWESIFLNLIIIDKTCPPGTQDGTTTRCHSNMRTSEITSSKYLWQLKTKNPEFAIS